MNCPKPELLGIDRISEKCICRGRMHKAIRNLRLVGILRSIVSYEKPIQHRNLVCSRNIYDLVCFLRDKRYKHMYIYVYTNKHCNN